MTDDAALSSYSWQPFKKAYCHTIKKETECRNNKGKCGGKSEKHPCKGAQTKKRQWNMKQTVYQF